MNEFKGYILKNKHLCISIYLSISLFSPLQLYSQTYKIKKLPQNQKGTAFFGKADSVFVISNNVSFSLSSHLASQNFDSFPDEIIFDEEYLKIMKDSLEIQPNHPIYLNNIGNYYSNNFEPGETNKFYKKALKYNL